MIQSLNSIIVLPPGLYEEATSLCARAYQNDAAVLKALGHLKPAKKLRILEKYWELLIRFTARHGTAFAILEGEKLAGIKLFYTHRQYPPPASSSLLISLKFALRLIPALGFKRFLRFFRTTSALLQKHPQAAHFYSELTCVDPVFQRRGIYTSLQKEMLHWAEEAGVGIYCETSNPTSAKIIQKFGFQVTGEENIDGVPYWFLWRKP